jgi:hypothetical protein
MRDVTGSDPVRMGLPACTAHTYKLLLDAVQAKTPRYFARRLDLGVQSLDIFTKNVGSLKHSMAFRTLSGGRGVVEGQ